MKIANLVAWIILLIGGFNWLLVGLFGFNLVTFVFGTVDILARIIYCLVGISAIWLLISPIAYHGRIAMWSND